MILRYSFLLFIASKKDVDTEVRRKFVLEVQNLEKKLNKKTVDMVNPVLEALDADAINPGENIPESNDNELQEAHQEIDKLRKELQELKKANENLQATQMKEDDLLKKEKELKDKEGELVKQVEEINNQKKDDTLVKKEELEKIEDEGVFPMTLLVFIPLTTLFMISVVVHILIFRIFFTVI